MSREIVYQMHNRVNGKPITLTGKGTSDGKGTMSIEADISDIPKNWNPIIVPCICSGPGGDGPGSGLFVFAPKGYQTSPATYRLASLYDETGLCIAAIRATGVYKRSEKDLDYKIDVDTKTAECSILPELTKIDH